jgi:hypothetical protein
MEIQEVRVGERGLFAWDGRILEVFGALKASGSRRFHPSVTELRIQEPDNKGRAVITLNWHDATTTIVQVEAEEFARLRPLLDEFAAAIQAAQQS